MYILFLFVLSVVVSGLLLPSEKSEAIIIIIIIIKRENRIAYRLLVENSRQEKHLAKHA
jgi:hypothetical protein